ncbi:MAG: LptF/LptG family permease [Bacteroidetes bacterium]|nr:LptF/LptG family permease [Bacteroidota bacterium]
MILWRYILRAHIGPFFFSNAIIIFLFLLQFLMKRAGDLVGKGLSPWVILELISLNLAWMLVLSVPMSMLVASLMAFGRLSADNEVTIMRASGMSLYRMMAPAIVAAVGVTVGLIWFNNSVLPDANVRLQTLMTDIVRIKPTLSLQAGVFTSDQELPSYRILVRRTFEKSNDLEGVTIYDLSDPERAVVVTAERGTVSFSADYSRIIMDLHDGEIHEVDNKTFLSYRKLRFVRHRVSIPASGFGFQRSDASTTRRDDRTMSAQMMQAIVDSIRLERDNKIIYSGDRMVNHLRGYFTGRPQFYSAAPMRMPPAMPAAVSMTREEVGSFGTRDVRPRAGRVRSGSAAARLRADSLARVDSLRRADSLSRAQLDTLGATFRALADARQLQSQSMAESSGIDFDEKQTDRYLVEIYKKYSIPVACLVFVLIGAPLGMMARRGGFGMGAGLSLGFFLFYWACLIGGEKLADRGELSPFWGMWVANLILGIMGAILVWRTAKESRVIDWSTLTRFVPKMLRGQQSSQDNVNPHEA